MIEHCERGAGLAFIHDLHLITKLAQSAGALPQPIDLGRKLVPQPKHPFAHSMLLGFGLAIKPAKLAGEIFEYRRRLAEENLTVAKTRHLSVTVLHKIVGLLLGAFAQIYVNV